MPRNFHSSSLEGNLWLRQDWISTRAGHISSAQLRIKKTKKGGVGHWCWSGKAGCIPLCIGYVLVFHWVLWMNEKIEVVLQFTVECEDWYIFAALNVVYVLHALGSTLIVEGFRDFWGNFTGFCKLGETILAINQWWTFFIKLRGHLQEKYEQAGILFFYLLFLHSNTFFHERVVVCSQGFWMMPLLSSL